MSECFLWFFYVKNNKTMVAAGTIELLAAVAVGAGSNGRSNNSYGSGKYITAKEMNTYISG